MKYKLLILFLLLLFLPACSPDSTDPENTVNYYYMQTELEFGTKSGVIKTTERNIEGHSDDYFYLISQYLNGPISYDCVSPFPAGTTLEELYWDQNRVQVILSPHITTLSGLDLMVACACLTRTVSDMTGINTVQIRPTSGLLNGEQAITLTADSFVYWDQTEQSDIFN